MTLAILVAEDHPETRLTLVRILEHLHPREQIDAVADGRQFVDFISRGSYALAFTYNSMPELTGIEAIANIRQRSITIPIVMISGDASEERTRERALAAGANEYLTKPYDLEDIRKVLARYVRK